MRVFVDANVWVDLMLERQPFLNQSVTMMSIVMDNNWRFGISSVSIVTAHFICHDRNKMPIAELKRKLSYFESYMDICTVSSDEIINAYNSDWNDFEDCVQYHTAKEWCADCIVTRNPRDFSKSELEILTPDEFIVQYGSYLKPYKNNYYSGEMMCEDSVEYQKGNKG